MNIKENTLECRLLDSLVKVFPDEAPCYDDFTSGSMLMNEVFSFQIAYRWNGPVVRGAKIKLDPYLVPFVCVYSTGLVPSELPCYHDHDDDVLRSAPGLFPDPLYMIGYDFEKQGYLIDLLPLQWRSFWIELKPEGRLPSGNHEISIEVQSADGSSLSSCNAVLEVIGEFLPEQELIYTNWFHADCIAALHKTGVFSETHWVLLEKYISEAVSHGMNMLLTPLFTPPLDTAEGGERPTTQLVEVNKSNGKYVFGFDKLDRWISIALSCGIKYFEMSHLFTQWGASHAPKIMSCSGKEVKRIFGWDTDASGEDYRSFLHAFLSELKVFLTERGLKDKCYFHVSDEPSLLHIGSYSAASGIIRDDLKEYKIIDALSDIEFYRNGLIRKPIPATDHIKPFLDEGIEGLWAYYCCGQYKGVSNRFFCMPSVRNRVLGMQLYKFDIEGFLHWGYNFWFTQFSISVLDPYKTTDAGHAFPSGDAFMVYPGDNGPVVSLRLKIFREALQDLRAARLLESRIGREAVLAMIDEGLEKGITFDEYPRSSNWLKSLRKKINSSLSEDHSAKK